MILRLVFVVIVLVGGCRQAAPPPPVVEVPAPMLPVEPPWTRTREDAQLAIDSARFTVADSILTAFIVAEAGSPAASDAAFWRALIAADPRNPAFSPATARAALEGYAASEGATRRIDAAVLLRQLAISDSLRTVIATQRTASEQRDRAREEELQRLREELSKTQAELERIKRRLNPPKP